MNKGGPIIVIEDTLEEQKIFESVFKKLHYKNEILFFEDGEKALEHLISTPVEPFIVFSDIDMPRLNGLELREQIHKNENLRLKCIPYLFFSSNSDQQYVIDAYSKSVQGFFIKPVDSEKLGVVLKKIIEYWKECESPNYVR